MKAKKAQGMTLWIIVAIVIVAMVLILFLTPLKDSIKNIFVKSSPDVQLKQCVEDKFIEAVELASSSGGSINPVNGYMLQGNKIEYLCYTNKYYQTCVMQQPLLKQHVEREILDYITPDVKNCIDSVKSDLQRNGYSVSGGNNIGVDITQNKINIELEGLTISNSNTGESYKDVKLSFDSQLYDLIMLSTSILNYEARYGDSEITTYMFYYPDVKVEKLKQSDGSKVYILTHESGDSFRFATRSLSWPGGYGIGGEYTPIQV